jgi:periplasmic protein CpxP/Spy
MKKRIVMALGLALLSGMALAQAQTQTSTQSSTQPHAAPAGGLKPGQKVAPPAQLKNDLGLTDEQVKKMREIRDNGGTREEMQAVLTPEQRAKQEELRKQHRGQRKSQMQQQMGLTDAQMKQMQEIRRKGGTREEMRAVLTPEQQAKFDARRAAHPAPPPKAAKAPAAKPAASRASTPASATPAPAGKSAE